MFNYDIIKNIQIIKQNNKIKNLAILFVNESITIPK